MRTRLFLTAFLPVLFAAAPSALADTATCKPTLEASIDLAIGHDAISVLAPAHVDGTRTFMVIDTGGIVSTLRYDIADNLHLPMQEAPMHMVNVSGQMLDLEATVGRFDFGPLHFNNVKFMLEPEHDLASGLHGPVGGTLAPDILRHYDIELDLAAAKMNLFSPSTCPNPAYWDPSGADGVKMEVLENGHILVPIQLDGKPLEALLDTGMSHTSIDLATARDRFGVDVHGRGVERVGGLTETEEGALYRYQFKTLAIANTRLSLEKPRVTLMPDLSGSHDRESRHAKMVVGLSTLRDLHVYIAYKQQMLYVTRASGPPAIYRGPELSDANRLRGPSDANRLRP
jgi:predicted aspartyl protease